MTIYGYARVSSLGQNTETQERLLKEAGAVTVLIEKKSGKDVQSRDKLSLLLEIMNEGDTLIVTRLDRLSRSTIDTMNLIQTLNDKGVIFRSLDLGLETNTPMGQFSLTIFSAVAELERTMIKERQLEGVRLAKSKGVYKGRKPVFDEYIDKVTSLKKCGYSVSAIAKRLEISRPTVYKCLKYI